MRESMSQKMTQEKLDEIIKDDLYGLQHKILFKDDYSGLDFKTANLENTQFIGCDLRWSDLSKTTINEHTDISATCLLDESTKMPKYPMACPEEGSFIGWKKLHGRYKGRHCICIAKLLIPETALRSSGISRKCRCSEALVLEIRKLVGGKELQRGNSIYNDWFIYTVGKPVAEPKFDTFRWHECAPGIHFYMTREEAVHR